MLSAYKEVIVVLYFLFTQIESLNVSISNTSILIGKYYKFHGRHFGHETLQTEIEIYAIENKTSFEKSSRIWFRYHYIVGDIEPTYQVNNATNQVDHNLLLVDPTRGNYVQVSMDFVVGDMGIINGEAWLVVLSENDDAVVVHMIHLDIIYQPKYCLPTVGGERTRENYQLYRVTRMVRSPYCNVDIMNYVFIAYTMKGRAKIHRKVDPIFVPANHYQFPKHIIVEENRIVVKFDLYVGLDTGFSFYLEEADEEYDMPLVKNDLVLTGIYHKYVNGIKSKRLFESTLIKAPFISNGESYGYNFYDVERGYCLKGRNSFIWDGYPCTTFLPHLYTYLENKGYCLIPSRSNDAMGGNLYTTKCSRINLVRKIREIPLQKEHLINEPNKAYREATSGQGINVNLRQVKTKIIGWLKKRNKSSQENPITSYKARVFSDLSIVVSTRLKRGIEIHAGASGEIYKDPNHASYNLAMTWRRLNPFGSYYYKVWVEDKFIGKDIFGNNFCYHPQKNKYHIVTKNEKYKHHLATSSSKAVERVNTKNYLRNESTYFVSKYKVDIVRWGVRIVWDLKGCENTVGQGRPAEFRSCKEIKSYCKQARSGYYYIAGKNRDLHAYMYCDMETDGGGWLSIVFAKMNGAPSPKIKDNMTDDVMEFVHSNYTKFLTSPIGLNNFSNYYDFEEMKFFCTSSNAGQTVHIKTLKNERGRAAVEYFRNPEITKEETPKFCKSYFRFNDDNSQITENCKNIGLETDNIDGHYGQNNENNKNYRLYFNTIMWKGHANFALVTHFRCDTHSVNTAKFRMPLENATFHISVR